MTAVEDVCVRCHRRIEYNGWHYNKWLAWCDDGLVAAASCRAPGSRWYGMHQPDMVTGLLAVLRSLAAAA